MIVGQVTNHQALLPVTFRLANRPDLTIEFVVDTGFVGFLTLPQAAVAALGLAYQFDTPANLADDSEVQMAVHGATIVWDGVERVVRVLATGKRPLLGMALLAGQELVVQCTDGGAVTVDPL
jgi:clan AA aspartic protease